MWTDLQFFTDLVTFTKAILNEILSSLCKDNFFFFKGEHKQGNQNLIAKHLYLYC